MHGTRRNVHISAIMRHPASWFCSYPRAQWGSAPHFDRKGLSRTDFRDDGEEAAVLFLMMMMMTTVFFKRLLMRTMQLFMRLLMRTM